MNQRQRKKFHKKLCKKKYINYRQALIIKTISERYGGFEVGGIVITDTRRMNLKHPLRIHYTIRCNLPDSLNFKVTKTYIKSQLIDTNEDAQSLRSMLDQWQKYIYGCGDEDEDSNSNTNNNE